MASGGSDGNDTAAVHRTGTGANANIPSNADPDNDIIADPHLALRRLLGSGPAFPGGLDQYELFWRDHQPWLRECGYVVRARYSPDWKPSWEGTGKHYEWCEDGILMDHPAILDATRLSDGKMVSLKKVVLSVHPYEADIAQFLSSKPLSRDARNHCVPIYEVLKVPSDNNTVILVMPFLRQFDDPEFQTVGEVVELCQQLFEGLRFMHENRVAHRDISTLNVMMDPAPMFPNLYHPIRTYMKRDFSGRVRFHYSRTERPTRYFYVDFGLSRRYGPDDNDPQELPILGGNKTVPEFQQEGYDMPSNPFCTDIYYLGDLIRDSFLKEYNGLEFMDALVSDMVQDDPRARPTMDVVIARFNAIRDSLSTWKLRSPLMKREHILLVRIFISLRHICRTVSYIMKRLPPIPTPLPLPDTSTSPRTTPDLEAIPRSSNDQDSCAQPLATPTPRVSVAIPPLISAATTSDTQVASSSLTDISQSTGEAVSPKTNEAVAPADEVVH